MAAAGDRDDPLVGDVDVKDVLAPHLQEHRGVEHAERNAPGVRLSEIPCKGRFHQASLNRSSNRMASWAFAITHSLGGIFHSLAARFNTRNNSLSALSSVGKCPLVLTARRSLAFKLSIEFVV